MAQDTFWNNREQAQKVIDEANTLRGKIEPLFQAEKQLEDFRVMIELGEAEPPEAQPKVQQELERDVTRMLRELDALELKVFLNGPHDKNNCILSINAGAGGTEACDWASMLMRMYQRWAESRGFSTELLETSPAEEAGIHSATLAIRGPYVYGLLKGETGNHRLIRMSPFDAAHRRQTSFAAVDVTPELDDNFSVDINWDEDVREDIFRSGGAGGQKVNKTDSAIRLTHLPTNTVVQCQNERSQHQNRALARKMMIAKLYQMEMDRRENELAAKRGQKSRIGFGGTTIRSYVLHPESYCKDNRSEYKTSHPQAALDGDLDPWIDAYLRWAMTQSNGQSK